jgi:pimeloyl-ACP methyl ester carboxylesterase
MATRDRNKQAKQITLQVNDHALYVERHGSPEKGTLTLLHHGLGSVRSWRRQVPEFVDAGWEVIVYDRWGYGRSDPRPEFADRYLLQDAHEALKLLDLLNISQSALIGHSEGGSIALLIAALQPARITCLVVVAAHIYYEQKMKAGLLSIAGSAEEPPLSTSLKREHGGRAKALTRMWIEHWLGSDPSSLDMSDRLGDIRSPVLVIQGELDEHATLDHARDIASGVQLSELWLIPAVGHMPPHEIPDEFNRRILTFLSRNCVEFAVEEDDVQ